MVDGSASTRPSCWRASDWIRGEASARESCDGERRVLGAELRALLRRAVELRGSGAARRGSRRRRRRAAIALTTIQAIAPRGARARRFALRGAASAARLRLRLRRLGAGRVRGCAAPASRRPRRTSSSCLHRHAEPRRLRARVAGDLGGVRAGSLGAASPAAPAARRTRRAGSRAGTCSRAPARAGSASRSGPRASGTRSPRAGRPGAGSRAPRAARARASRARR